MTEMQRYFNPETGKPNPVSVREFYLMDRKEQRAFQKSLTRKEKRDFQLQFIVEVDKLPKSEKIALSRAFVDKLKLRDNKSIGDKVELFRAKLYAKRAELPTKQPIFFRKFRTGETPWPTWVLKTRSPYLIRAM